MLGKRPLQHESLESRRLLAADCEAVEAPAAEIDELTILNAVSKGQGESIVEGQAAELSSSAMVFPGILYGGQDLVQEQGNKLFVVDQDPFDWPGQGELFIFERRDDGSLETLKTVELGFAVRRMIVAGDQVLLFGYNDYFAYPAATTEADRVEHSSVVTVNLGSDFEVVRQKFEGTFVDVYHEGDRVTIVSSSSRDYVIAVYPPPPLTGTLTTYDITADGLSKIASAEISLFGITQASGNDFYSLTTGFPEIDNQTSDDPNNDGIVAPEEPVAPTTTLTRYRLGEDSIEIVGSRELGVGYPSRFEVSDDGQTAVLVRNQYSDEESITHVDLLDLSGEAEDSIRVFETISLPNLYFSEVLVSGSDYVVLRSYHHNTLVVIDVNQGIDVAAENRVRRIELPDSLNVGFESIRVSDDRLVLQAERTTESTETDASGHPIRQPGPKVLLTVSLSEARIIADTRLPDSIGSYPSLRFFSIDSESQRFGFTAVGAYFADGAYFEVGEQGSGRLVFGHLGEDGDFDQDGAIPVGQWLELDANPQRLIVRQYDRIVEYDWENTGEPIVTPLGALDPIEAVNDEYTLIANGEDHLLDVLANDKIRRSNDRSNVEIVGLEGAPQGADIVGDQILIPAAALKGIDSLRFEYIISNGVERSAAVVEINVEVESDRDARVREVVQLVRAQAAEDFDVPVDQVEIRSVEKVFDEPLPVVIPGEQERDLSPGILVLLRTPEVRAVYAASLEGEIIQVFASPREEGEEPEKLVEFALRPVDASGQVLDEVTEGDTFWIEFIADDLRQFGKGVFAAFLDLVVPTDQLVLTGAVEYGEGFSEFGRGEISEGEIDDLGAIGSVFGPPESATDVVYRFEVQAVAPGEVTLQPDPADRRGTETLIYGYDYEVDDDQVIYTPLSLNIIEEATTDPLDVNGSGSITASDALMVINFLGAHGPACRLAAAQSLVDDGCGFSAEDLSVYDTNGSGTVTPLDALVIINAMGKQSFEAERVDVERVDVAIDKLIEDDDDEEDDQMARMVEMIGI